MSDSGPWHPKPTSPVPRRAGMHLAEPARRRVRIGLLLALVSDLIAQLGGFYRGLELVFAYIVPLSCGYGTPECASDQMFTAAGFALQIACVVAFLATLAGIAATVTFFRTDRPRDANRAAILTAVGLLLPILGIVTTHLILLPLPSGEVSG